VVLTVGVDPPCRTQPLLPESDVVVVAEVLEVGTVAVGVVAVGVVEVVKVGTVVVLEVGTVVVDVGGEVTEVEQVFPLNVKDAGAGFLPSVAVPTNPICTEAPEATRPFLPVLVAVTVEPDWAMCAPVARVTLCPAPKDQVSFQALTDLPRLRTATVPTSPAPVWTRAEYVTEHLGPAAFAVARIPPPPSATTAAAATANIRMDGLRMGLPEDRARTETSPSCRRRPRKGCQAQRSS
jgi:hypothetical protein